MKFEKWLQQKCDKIIKFVKRRPYTSTFSLLFVLSFIPLIVWLCYFIGDCGFVLVKTSLTIDGYLGFYGAFLAFLGTVALSTIALWQNRVYQLDNQKLNQKIFEIQIFSNASFFKVESCKVVFDDDEMERFHLYVILRNVGKSIAMSVMPYEFEFSKIGYKVGKASEDVIIQVREQSEANILPQKSISIISEPLKYTMLNQEDYFAHISISIVSESQAQYDQEIQLHFKYTNGHLKYLNEYPSKFLKLYGN